METVGDAACSFTFSLPGSQNLAHTSHDILRCQNDLRKILKCAQHHPSMGRPLSISSGKAANGSFLREYLKSGQEVLELGSEPSYLVGKNRPF